MSMRRAVSNWTLATLLLMVVFPGLSAAQEAADDPAAISPEVLAQIKGAKTADELVALGKQFASERQLAAAERCIVEACRLDKDLLTDNERESPRSWNELWFICRARIRAEGLGKEDAAGRVLLARWLLDAGFPVEARRHAADAIEIDPDLPEAQALAEELKPQAGLDLRYALTNSVFLETFKDGSDTLEPRRGCDFLLAPMYYLVTDRRLVLTGRSADITTDDGKRCWVRGLLLSERLGRGVSDEHEMDATALRAPPAEPPTSFEAVVYERIQVELRDGKPTLIWQNNNPSEVTSYSRRDTSSDKRGEAVPTGWAALLIDCPTGAKELRVQILDQDPETVDLVLLGLIQNGKDRSREKLADLVKEVSGRAATSSAVTAQLALAWLSEFSSSSWSGSSEEVDASLVTIEKTLLAGLGHADQRVRKQALQGLVGTSKPLSDDAVRFIRSHSDQKFLLKVLAEVESSLKAAKVINQGDSDSRFTGTRGLAGPAAIEEAIGDRPASSAPENLFSLLSACLNSEHAEVRRRAMRICLADATRESMQLLVELGTDGRRTLIEELKDVRDNDLKAAVLRVLLIRPNPTTAPLLLQACDGLSVTITSEGDPLLGVLKGRYSEAILVALLGLLSRSDLSAVIESEEVGNTLERLSAEDSARVQVALLGLVVSQLDLPYVSPVRRGTPKSTRSVEPPPGVSGLEALATRLMMEPEVDVDTARRAAIALVASGRLAGIREEFRQSSDVQRRRSIVQALGEDKQLWGRDALPTFLASCLGLADPKTQQQALAFLVAIGDEAEADNRCWQVSLAAKQGIDEEEPLVRLTVHPDERVSQDALKLCRRLASMTPSDYEAFRQDSGEARRLDRLRSIIKSRTNKPAGDYACMVYVDVETYQPASADVGRARVRRSPGRRSIPLASLIVSIKEGGDGWRVFADRKEITFPGEPSSRGRSDSGSSSISLELNADELLRAAVDSRDAHREGLQGRVDLLPFTQPLRCELAPDVLGSWAGEVEVSRGTLGPDHPVRVTSARIVLEPIGS